MNPYCKKNKWLCTSGPHDKKSGI